MKTHAEISVLKHAG